MAEKKRPKQGGLAKRGRKLGDASRKRENAFKDLSTGLANLANMAQSTDSTLANAIRKLERRHRFTSRPPPKKERDS